jgi:hypothetical protein
MVFGPQQELSGLFGSAANGAAANYCYTSLQHYDKYKSFFKFSFSESGGAAYPLKRE